MNIKLRGVPTMTKKTTKKNVQTTYDRFMQKMSPEQKKQYEQGYKELVLSELLLALMEEDNVSVRKLAKEAGLSSAIIQGIRSGEKENITIQSFMKILNALGCLLVVEKDNYRYQLASE